LIDDDASGQELRAIWTQFAGRRSNNVNTLGVKLPKPIVIAIIYMRHVREFIAVPEGGRKIDGERMERLKRYDCWTKCKCQQDCPRRWNFANDIGMSTPNNENDGCKVYRLSLMERKTREKDNWEQMWQRWRTQQISFEL
jgi:hypothetical protein